MFCRRASLGLVLGALLLGADAVCAAERWLVAPGQAAPVNQLGISGNACGPASLLNALLLGDENWRRAGLALEGSGDRERLTDMIRRYGLKPSVSLRDRQRWQVRHGMNLEDLTAMGNDMVVRQGLPAMRASIYQAADAAAAAKLLGSVHADLARSLGKGLPPVVSLRRHALRSPGKGPAVWTAVLGHFVVITGMPKNLPRGASSFPVTYLDPWRGRRGQAEVRAALPSAFQLGLVADFPDVAAGLDQVKKGEKTLLTLNAALGRL
jgi:hypothetical protein